MIIPVIDTYLKGRWFAFNGFVREPLSEERYRIDFSNFGASVGAILFVREGESVALQNAIEQCFSRIANSEFTPSLAVGDMNLSAFKTYDKIRLFPTRSGAYSMSRVETRRDRYRFFCNGPLESRNQLLTAFSIPDDSCAEDPVAIEVTIGRIQLKARVQGEKFEVIGLVEDRCGSRGDFVPISTETVGGRTHLLPRS